MAQHKHIGNSYTNGLLWVEPLRMMALEKCEEIKENENVRGVAPWIWPWLTLGLNGIAFMYSAVLDVSTVQSGLCTHS